VHRALNPYVQLLKPISPLAWMPLALYTIKDSSVSPCSSSPSARIWPMLLNTAHGVASVKREWLDVAAPSRCRRSAGVPRRAAAAGAHHPHRHAHLDGIAWLVIVAAEMLVGGTASATCLERVEQPLRSPTSSSRF